MARFTRGKYSNARWVASPNAGKRIRPRLLVLHYTAVSLKHTLDIFKAPGVSAHFVVAENGKITQMVDCNRSAFHAGKSEWKGRKNCNNFSIGIEIVNYGHLGKYRGIYKSWNKVVISNSSVMRARHLLMKRTVGWPKFPPRQIEVVKKLCRDICRRYGIKDIAGHEDIARPRGRKVDPGPVFPMADVKDYALSVTSRVSRVASRVSETSSDA